MNFVNKMSGNGAHIHIEDYGHQHNELTLAQSIIQIIS